MIPVLSFAASAAVALPASGLAPPLDRTLHVETEEEAQLPGRAPQRFSMKEAVRFTRAGAGYALHTKLLSATAAPDVPAAGRALFDLAMAPSLGRTVTILLDADGRPQSVVDADRLWEAMASAQQAVAERAATDPDLPPPMKAAVGAVAASFRTTPAAERRERLLRSAWALVGLAGGPESMKPGGTVRLERSDAAAHHFRIAAEGEDGRYVVDRATGLTLAAEVVRTLPPGAGTQTRRTRLIF